MKYKDVILQDAKGNIVPLQSYYGEQRKECLIDLVHKKIVLNGNSLNSNDVCSQYFTGVVLSHLCKKNNAVIEARYLPKTSYTTSKYNFQHRIIRPLELAIEKYLKKTLKIVCIGTMTDFVVKLLYSEVDMYFLLPIEGATGEGLEKEK